MVLSLPTPSIGFRACTRHSAFFLYGFCEEWMKSWGICIVDRHGHVKDTNAGDPWELAKPPFGPHAEDAGQCVQKLATPASSSPDCNLRLYYRDLPLRLANPSCCVVHNKRTEFPGCVVGALYQSTFNPLDSSFYVRVSVIPLFLHHHPSQASRTTLCRRQQGSGYQTVVPCVCKANPPHLFLYFHNFILHNVLWQHSPHYLLLMTVSSLNPFLPQRSLLLCLFPPI